MYEVSKSRFFGKRVVCRPAIMRKRPKLLEEAQSHCKCNAIHISVYFIDNIFLSVSFIGYIHHKGATFELLVITLELLSKLHLILCLCFANNPLNSRQPYVSVHWLCSFLNFEELERLDLSSKYSLDKKLITNIWINKALFSDMYTVKPLKTDIP